jgi:hypothetical protein
MMTDIFVGFVREISQSLSWDFSDGLRRDPGYRMPAVMVTLVSTGRCKCGTRIKVIGETEHDNTSASSVAECPQCGDRQTIHTGKIISVYEDIDDTKYRTQKA